MLRNVGQGHRVASLAFSEPKLKRLTFLQFFKIKVCQ